MDGRILDKLPELANKSLDIHIPDKLPALRLGSTNNAIK